MAHIDPALLCQEEKEQLICSYAAMLLHDAGVEITADKLNKVIKASNNTVEAYWPVLFAKAFEGQNISQIIADAAVPAAVAVEEVAAEEEKVEEAEDEVENDESEVGLFENIFGDDEEEDEEDHA